MKQKKATAFFFLLSLIGLGVGYAMVNAIKFGICYTNLSTNTFDTSCINFVSEFGFPLLYGMAALAIVFLILFFIPRAFSLWWKFAIWYVPLTTIVVIWSKPNGSWIDIGPTPEQAALWLSGFYVVVSGVIIAISALRNKK